MTRAANYRAGEIVQPCACDACGRDVDPELGEDQDGYCEFCAERCFPMAYFDDEPQRMRLTPAARRRIHATPTELQTPQQASREVLETMARNAARVLWPVVRPHVERKVGQLAKRILGR